jgi:DnaJ-class molecular chaperone
LQRAEINHYTALGLDRDCTDAQIRAAYRFLAKQYHPDLNSGSAEANGQTRAINAAYAVLSDATQRQIYDRQLDAQKTDRTRAAGSQRNLSQEIHLRLEDFLRGTTLQVSVRDPVQRDDNETYELIIPPETAPGTRFRLVRRDGGFVTVKTRVRPDFRFKVRGANLRCDLKINAQRAWQGGSESVRGVTGNFLRVQIPARVERGEVIRIAGEGLPKARGGRGDLLVRIIYRPEVRITRVARS